MDKLYAAPMEGLTGYLWRQVHAELFGPADKYFTPFLSPNATLPSSGKSWMRSTRSTTGDST